MKSPIHLNALRAFEASARHQSFSAAAQELNVTPAAVGQLVRTLEEWLGVELFQRIKSGKVRLIPSETAERALPEIRAGFDRLMIGLEQLKTSPSSNVLTVAVSPAFAAKWLLPRMERFQEVCSVTDVRLDTSLKLVDFAAQRIDIGVRYGLGRWSNLEAEKWMDEEVFPVCSPNFLTQQSQLNQPHDLLNVTLIHDLSLDAYTGFPTWADWLNKANAAGNLAANSIKINNSAAVLQTAIEGNGVALARSVMVKDDVASGRLVRLFPEIHFESPLAYYIVHPPGSGKLPKIKAFKEWLYIEMQRDEVNQRADLN